MGDSYHRPEAQDALKIKTGYSRRYKALSAWLAARRSHCLHLTATATPTRHPRQHGGFQARYRSTKVSPPSSACTSRPRGRWALLNPCRPPPARRPVRGWPGRVDGLCAWLVVGRLHALRGRRPPPRGVAGSCARPGGAALAVDGRRQPPKARSSPIPPKSASPYSSYAPPTAAYSTTSSPNPRPTAGPRRRHGVEAEVSPVADENVQFTVYRPRAIRPGLWYPMLAFAHLAERRPDAPPEEPTRSSR